MSECRQKLKAEGKTYPRSGCAVCGQFSPRWKECEAKLAGSTTPPQPICDEAKERGLFEAYCAKVGLPLDTLPSGEYLIPVTRFVSQGWHARAKAGEGE